MKYIYDTWESIMNHDRNPLKNIPHTNTRHMIMQVLAWMWCIAFSSYFSSMWIFGVTAIAVTVATFETARRKPDFFLRNDGYHTTSRSRYIYYNGKRYERDPQDMGGEHE